MCPEFLRKSRGCTEPREEPLKLDQDIKLYGGSSYKYTFDYCPVNYVSAEHKYIIALSQLFKQGKMLESGGVGDQDAKYIDMMLFMEYYFNKAEHDALEKARSEVR